MPAYMVVEVRYDDSEWTAAYRRDVPPMLERAGARYVAKSLTPERLEGDEAAPDTLAVVEFPSAEAARAFLASPEYQPYGEARRAGARTRIYLIGD
jgi:uncharacterized protein (DUF1330 family)